MEFYSKNPTPIGSRPRGLIGLWRMTTQETPPPRTHKEGQGGQGKPNRQKGAAGEGGGSIVIEEGNREPVNKATIL